MSVKARKRVNAVMRARVAASNPRVPFHKQVRLLGAIQNPPQRFPKVNMPELPPLWDDDEEEIE